MILVNNKKRIENNKEKYREEYFILYHFNIIIFYIYYN